MQWAVWNQKSPHVPELFHTSADHFQTLLAWLVGGPPSTPSVAATQRYCLVMGMTLRDLQEVQFIEPDTVPDHLPPYLATSCWSFTYFEQLLQVCSSAFLAHTTPKPPQPKSRLQARIVAPEVTVQPALPSAGVDDEDVEMRSIEAALITPLSTGAATDTSMGRKRTRSVVATIARETMRPATPENAEAGPSKVKDPSARVTRDTPSSPKCSRRRGGVKGKR